MQKGATIWVVIVILLAVLGIWWISVSQNQNPEVTFTPNQSQQVSEAVKLGSNSVLGSFLVDAKGMTLYTFTTDIKGTATVPAKSNCTGQCLVNWPVFSISNVIAPSLLKEADFATIVRQDGTNQLTYKGSPLYYYIQDNKSGDTLGDAVGNVWFVVKP